MREPLVGMWNSLSFWLWCSLVGFKDPMSQHVVNPLCYRGRILVRVQRLDLDVWLNASISMNVSMENPFESNFFVLQKRLEVPSLFRDPLYRLAGPYGVGVWYIRSLVFRLSSEGRSQADGTKFRRKSVTASARLRYEGHSVPWHAHATKPSL